MDRSTRLARVADKISVVTSQIFRCQGLDRVSSRADRLGLHDVFYWIVFASIISAWFFFLFMPERERLHALLDRRHTLDIHLREENKELHRLQRGIHALLVNDPTAWERAARGTQGWVEPGEFTDASILKHCRVKPLPPVAPYSTSDRRPIPPVGLYTLDTGNPLGPSSTPAHSAPSDVPKLKGTPTNPVPSLPRPSMPTLPVPSESLRSAGLRLDAALPLDETFSSNRRKLTPEPTPPLVPIAPLSIVREARRNPASNGNGNVSKKGIPPNTPSVVGTKTDSGGLHLNLNHTLSGPTETSNSTRGTAPKKTPVSKPVKVR